MALWKNGFIILLRTDGDAGVAIEVCKPFQTPFRVPGGHTRCRVV